MASKRCVFDLLDARDCLVRKFQFCFAVRAGEKGEKMYPHGYDANLHHQALYSEDRKAVPTNALELHEFKK